jgi:AcrR family transcriptional regulator
LKSERQHRRREQTTQEILATARAIMRAEGVAALSMQELARRLDIKAPSLYNYFSGKHDIYDALFRMGFEQFDALMEEQLNSASGWPETLDSSIRAYMSFALRNPELYQLCFERPVPGFVPSAASMEVSLRALRRGHESVAHWRPDIRSSLSDEQITDLIIAVAHGLTALHLANQPDLPLGEGRFGGLVSAAVSVLQTALAAPERAEGNLS